MKHTLRSFLLLILLASPLAAQSSSRPLEFPRDSALFRMLTAHIVQELRTTVQVLDPAAPRPVFFYHRFFGDSTRWLVLEQDVLKAVGGHPPLPTDTLRFSVRAGGGVESDTLFRGYVQVDIEEPCNLHWSSSVPGFNLYSSRGAERNWSTFRRSESNSTDGQGCLMMGGPLKQMRPDPKAVANLRREHPCPAKLPSWWTAADRSLGKGFRCNLVAAALEAAVDTIATPHIPAVDGSSIRCARLEGNAYVLRPDQPESWIVHFVTDQRQVRVEVESRAGKATRLGGNWKGPGCGG